MLCLSHFITGNVIQLCPVHHIFNITRCVIVDVVSDNTCDDSVMKTDTKHITQPVMMSWDEQGMTTADYN